MLFSVPEIIFLSAFILLFGGYRVYTEATGKTGPFSKWYAAGSFLCAGLELVDIVLWLRRDLSLGDMIPECLSVLIFLALGVIELRRAKGRG